MPFVVGFLVRYTRGESVDTRKYTQGEVRHRVYGHDTIAILWV